METLLRDLTHSLRMFRQNPGFTMTAVAALALGIGTNTAIFSVVNTVLLRPVRAPEPERVVTFINTSKDGSTSTAASEIKFNLYREQTAVVEDVSAYRYGMVNLTGVDQPQRADAIYVTSDYFRLFGIPVAQGRGFTAEEQRTGGPQVVVLSDGFWKRAFGSDPHIVGKTVSLSADSFQVIGVLAEGFQPETIGPVDVWFPFPIDPNSTYQVHYFFAAGRLKAGIPIEAANAQLKIATEEFQRRYPNTLSSSRADAFSVEQLQSWLVKTARPALLTFSIAVSLVLLIACANVANLLLVRAAGRRREIAIRVAVGAARGRIIRQLLTESLLLSSVAAVFGLGIGLTGIHALLTLSAGGLPRLGVKGANVVMDWRVGLFTVVVALLTGVLFGLIPAMQASRTDVNANLKENSGRSGIGFRQNKARSLLVVSEVSLALLLLIGSALLIRTLIALRSVNPGFSPGNVLTTRTSIDPKVAKAASADQLIQNTLRRVSSVSGVESAGYTRILPLEGSFNSLNIIIVGRPLNGPSHGNSRWVVMSPGYFDALKIPVLRGRAFTDQDRMGTPLVAIVNQAFARKFWPDGEPVGAQLFIGKGLGPNFEEPAREVVGIVGNVHDDALNVDTQPAVFVPGAQIAEARWAGTSVAWVMRTKSQSQSLNAAIENELRQATGVPVPALRSMQDVLVESTARQDFNMLLMSIFGGSALLLAAIGVYGLMAYSVQQRAQEMGIRMALGARPEDVRNMVVFQGMRLAVAGVMLGTGAAFGLAHFIASLLFGVAAWDPVVFVTAPVLLAVVAFAAVWLPAQRASRVDPARALRCE